MKKLILKEIFLIFLSLGVFNTIFGSFLKDIRLSLFPGLAKHLKHAESSKVNEESSKYILKNVENPAKILTNGQKSLEIHDVPLDANDTLHMYWQIDYKSKEIRIEVHILMESAYQWAAVGFSDRGHMIGSDMCVLWMDWKNNVHFQVFDAVNTAYYYANVYVDYQKRWRRFSTNECREFKFKIDQKILKFKFRRTFNPCSRGHYVIERGTTHIRWSKGAGPLFEVEGVLAHGDRDGNVMLELLKPELEKPREKGSEKLLVVAKKAPVPAHETTYWCAVHKLPEQFKEKHHVLKFGAEIQKENKDIVHHMEVFHCEYPPGFEVPLYKGPCHGETRPKEIDKCKRVLAAWAMGALDFVYPNEAGLPIGGDDFNPYVMLEVHYNNPKLFEGRIDSSGIALTYTSKLRQHDAGVMELGLEYTPKMAIPPRMKSFVLSGYCIPECTALGIPKNGIYIFGSQLHTHLTGVRVWTKHYREENELEDLNRDDHYSTHFQEIRRLPENVHILPGDALVTQCEYATPNRRNVTVGGFSISDEMCVNYVHYFPKLDLEVCKSSVDSSTLFQYFDAMRILELQNTSQKLEWGENYRTIEWNPLRSSFLQSFYDEAPLSMQCNRSNGDRYPGFWENKEIPRVTNLHEKENECTNELNLE